MLTKQIRSLQHKLVKDAVRLRTSKRFREEKNAVLVSGKKIIQELCEHFIPEALFFTENPLVIPALSGYQVTPSILKKIAGIPSPDGYVAIFPKKAHNLTMSPPLLILDGLQDPGNVGTLFRTAFGLGWKEIALIGKTADPWGEKALRASKGAVFHLPHAYKTHQEINLLFQRKKLHIYLADLQGSALEKTSLQHPLALILSSEGKGAIKEAYPKASLLSLPMHPWTESYNVASAGSILLYALRPHE